MKNSKRISLLAVMLALAALVGWIVLSSQREARRSETLAQAERLFKDGDYQPALMDGCTEEMPQSGLIAQSWDNAMSDEDGGTASVTVYTGKKAALLTMTQLKKPNPTIVEIDDTTGNYITVLVQPHSSYTFRFPAGYYRPSVSQGELWFGEKERFGILKTVSDVDVHNFYDPQRGNRMEGGYSITLQ